MSDDAFADLFIRYWRRVLGFVSRRVPGPDAEDVASETFVRAWTHRGQLTGAGRGSDPILSWLCTVALRLVIDRARRRRVIALPDDYEIVDPAPDFTQQSAERMDRRVLFAHLSAKQGSVMRLALAGHSSTVIARELGMSSGGTKKLYQRGVAALRRAWPGRTAA